MGTTTNPWNSGRFKTIYEDGTKLAEKYSDINHKHNRVWSGDETKALVLTNDGTFRRPNTDSPLINLGATNYPFDKICGNTLYENGKTLSSQYLKDSISRPINFESGSIPRNNSLPYFIGIEAYADGGGLRYIAKGDVCDDIGAAKEENIKFHEGTNKTNVSVSASTWTDVATLTVDADGTFIVTGGLQWASSTSGTRIVRIIGGAKYTTTETSNAASQNACGTTRQNLTIVSNTDATNKVFKIQAYSSVATTVAGVVRAVRIK
ncbi:MAG: hypothetical protein Q4C42_05190 [Clostridia bacterium]|nr:hypothetical protein [Clostridia bacterium]